MAHAASADKIGQELGVSSGRGTSYDGGEYS